MNDQVKATITQKSADGTFTAIASTASIDRHGEIVNVEGWDVKNFKKNPVLLWAHDHSIPAIGTATKIWVEGTGKKAKLMFNGKMQQATDTGKALTQLVVDGVLKTFSVGFLPTDMDGNTYIKQELLEISLVNVPANPDAMMQAVKSLRSNGFSDEVIEEVGLSVQVVDKLVTMEKDIKELNGKVETLVKAQPPAASKSPSKVIRSRQSLVKVMAKTADILLTGEKSEMAKEERVRNIKVMKRAAEILSESHKGELNG